MLSNKGRKELTKGRNKERSNEGRNGKEMKAKGIRQEGIHI